MHVRFSEENEIFEVPNNEQEDRSIGSMYYRNLIQNCESAERNLVKMINDHCKNQIILTSYGYPLTVRDMSIPWYRDDTVCKIYQHLITNKEFATNFFILFDQEVDSVVGTYEISEIELILDNVSFYFNKVIGLPKL